VFESIVPGRCLGELHTYQHIARTLEIHVVCGSLEITCIVRLVCPPLASFLAGRVQTFWCAAGGREEGVVYRCDARFLRNQPRELFLTARFIKMRKTGKGTAVCVISDRPREGNRTATPYENTHIPDGACLGCRCLFGAPSHAFIQYPTNRHSPGAKNPPSKQGNPEACSPIPKHGFVRDE
jgi:hypothetical protein